MQSRFLKQSQGLDLRKKTHSLQILHPRCGTEFESARVDMEMEKHAISVSIYFTRKEHVCTGSAQTFERSTGVTHGTLRRLNASNQRAKTIQICRKTVKDHPSLAQIPLLTNKFLIEALV